MNNSDALRSVVQKYFEKETATAALSLETMDEEQALEVLVSLPPLLAARVLKHLQVSFAAAILKNADSTFFHALASGLDPQLAASLLMYLPNDIREKITLQIDGKLKKEIMELLAYPEDSVGRMMDTDFLSFNKSILAGEAIDKIRSLSQKRYPASYAYVVDDDQRLIGVLNMRDLMLAPADQRLETIMRKDIFSLHCFTERQEAANELSKRKYFAAPVVDSENRILGIVKAERMLQGIQDDVTSDIQKMVGVSADEHAFSTIGFSLKKRLPWLHINLATAFLAASVVALFEDVIARITMLAVFLPVVAGQGGNAGAQSLAVVMRGLVMREIPPKKAWALISKEGKLGLINGAVTGLVTALVAWWWHGNPILGVVIGLGMLVNLFFAGLSGASIPLFMRKVGLDPAQSAVIILTTVTDVVGFASFLGFALLFQNYLV